MAFQSCKVVKENMDKKPLNTTQNSIDLLNTLTYEEMEEMGIRGQLEIILWARRFINKHNHVKIVQERKIK